MIIRSKEFIISNTNPAQCPETVLPEYAMIGRSNVGKSSLINMLTGSKKLAKISGRPGKTQLINHFLINDSWYLVDLPGYGFARISKSQRGKWQKMIRQYFTTRRNLYCVVLLIDSRVSPQKSDLEFAEFLAETRTPFVLAFTKADKLSKSKVAKNIHTFKEKMLETWDALPQSFVTSAESGEGRKELLAFIDELNNS